MKTLIALFLLLFNIALVAQTDIVAGGGECKVTGDPDLHPVLDDAALNNCWLAVDVNTGEKYWYNPLGTLGDRWNLVSISGSTPITLAAGSHPALTLNGQELNLDLSGIGGGGSGNGLFDLTNEGAEIAINIAINEQLTFENEDDERVSLMFRTDITPPLLNVNQTDFISAFQVNTDLTTGVLGVTNNGEVHLSSTDRLFLVAFEDINLKNDDTSFNLNGTGIDIAPGAGKHIYPFVPVYASTAAALADSSLPFGAMFAVDNGDGTSALHFKA